jgi:hypothetical protein
VRVARSICQMRPCRSGGQRVYVSAASSAPSMRVQPASVRAAKSVQSGWNSWASVSSHPDGSATMSMVTRLASDPAMPQGERQASRPVDLQVFSNVIDLGALAAGHEGEPASGLGVDREAHHLLVADGRTEHPPADHRRVRPGVEDALGRCAKAAHRPDDRRAHGDHPFCPRPPRPRRHDAALRPQRILWPIAVAAQ